MAKREREKEQRSLLSALIADAPPPPSPLSQRVTASAAQLRMACASGWKPEDVKTEFASYEDRRTHFNEKKAHGEEFKRNNHNRNIANGMAWAILVKDGMDPKAFDPFVSPMSTEMRIWKKHGFKGLPWDVVAVHINLPDLPISTLKELTEEQAKVAHKRIRTQEDEEKLQTPDSSGGASASNPPSSGSGAVPFQAPPGAILFGHRVDTSSDSEELNILFLTALLAGILDSSNFFSTAVLLCQTIPTKIEK